MDAIEEITILRKHKAALQEAVIQVAEQRDEVYANLEAATLLIDGLAEQIDKWFPNDDNPEVQTDLRNVSTMLRDRYRFRTLDEFMGESNE
jgi:hypothetical protein